MKKVLIAKQSLDKTYSGACRSVHEEIIYFNKMGCEVHTIAENTNDIDVKKSGATPHKSFRWLWQKKIKRRLQFSNQSIKLAKTLGIELLIGHGDLQSGDVHFVHNCVHLASEKIHGKELAKTNEMYQIHTPIFAKQQFKHFVANSILTKKELISRFKIPSGKISVIYPAVDETIFKRLSSKEISVFREELGVGRGEFFVGLITSGNFKKRGVDRFFKAIDLLPEEVARKTHFIFVGKDKLSHEFQEILNACKYKDRIKLLPIIDNVEKYFSSLDIFVLPARIEEFGRVVAEAMSCGAPVITTKWVGAAELMEGESEKFVYDGDDNLELAQLMETLLEDRNLRLRLSELNQESASKVFHSNLSEKFEKVFNSYIF